jgi:hypothetical protein
MVGSAGAGGRLSSSGAEAGGETGSVGDAGMEPVSRFFIGLIVTALDSGVTGGGASAGGFTSMRSTRIAISALTTSVIIGRSLG